MYLAVVAGAVEDSNGGPFRDVLLPPEMPIVHAAAVGREVFFGRMLRRSRQLDWNNATRFAESLVLSLVWGTSIDNSWIPFRSL